ncbi:MAG: ABC transporter substrate-binding protein [Rhodocyclaceae bacterium]
MFKKTLCVLACGMALGTFAGAASAAEELMIYTSMKESLIGRIKDAFVKKNPGIKVDYQSAGAGKLMAKIATERQSGRIMTDLLWTSEVPDFYHMKSEGLLEKYSSPELKNVVNPLPDFDGSFTAVRLGTLGVAYNTRYIKTAPKTWKDIAGPAYKGAFGIANPALSGTSYMSVQLLVDAFGWDYIKSLKANGAKVGKGSGQVVDDTASGDLVGSLGVDYIVSDKIEKGATMALAYPPEMLVIPSPVAIIKGTKNLPVAQKFVDFLLSAECQDIIAQEGTVPVRKGVKAAVKGIPTAEEAQARAMKIDYVKIINAKEATIKQFNEIMQIR